MLAPESQFYFSQRLKLHYVDWGNDTGPTLLLLHGGRDHCRSWDAVARHFCTRYHVVAPDLRGHGDSSWSLGSHYTEIAWIHDVAQLIHQRGLAPVIIVGHSLGGSIGLLYSGIFTEMVRKTIAIEGLGPSPKQVAERQSVSIDERMRQSIQKTREVAGRMARRYATIADAAARMKFVNPRLSDEQARHLTAHGIYRNEDGTYSWKFDDMMRLGRAPGDLSYEQQHTLWARICCPVLLIRGVASWASDPLLDGRLGCFRDVQSVNIDGAGHWVHHDRLDEFLQLLEQFLGL